LGERFSQVSVPERAGGWAGPVGVAPLYLFALDVWPADFDRPGSEEVLVAGDLGPDEDGGVFAFPVVNDGADGVWDARKLADQEEGPLPCPPT